MKTGHVQRHPLVRPSRSDPFRPARRYVPKDVRINSAGDIEWRGSQFQLLTDAGAADGCLRAFLLLADEAQPATFSDFAGKWGVLGICSHGFARFQEGCDHFNPMGGLPLPSIAFTEWRSEPIGAWRASARELRGFLRLGMQLQRNMPGAESDWGTAVGHLRGEPIALLSGASTIQERRTSMARALGQRITEAGIVPALDWAKDQPNPSLYLRLGWEMPIYIPDTLYAVLVAQLVAAVSVAIPECSNCGEPCAIGPNERLLRRDRRVFCSDRCRDIVDRERKRLWAENRRNTPTVPRATEGLRQRKQSSPVPKLANSIDGEVPSADHGKH